MIFKNFFKITPQERRVKISKNNGIVFSNPRWWKRFIFYFGSILVIFSLITILYIYEPIIISLVKYKFINQEIIADKIETFKSKNLLIKKITPTEAFLDEKTLLTPTPTLIQSNEFEISIPEIGAEAEIQANVSTANKEEYMEVLKNNVVAQALGTALPGDGAGKTIFLFAHSSEQGIFDARDNPVFYLLGKLKINDDILINYRGKIYTYKVYIKKITKAQETAYLNYSENGKEILILQTCWPIGTNWQRLLVFAEKI